MTQAKALYRAALKGLIAGISFGRSKTKKLSVALVVGLVVALFVYLSVVYNISMAGLFASLGVAELLFGVLGVLAVVLCAVLQANGAKDMLFGTKDMDVLLALPVRPVQLLGARLAALYTESLLLVAACMLPTLGFYWVYAGFSVMACLRLLFACLLLACLPVALSLVLGYLLAWVASVTTHKALFENIMYFGVIGLLVVVSFAFPRAMETVTEISGEGLYVLLGGQLPPAVWLARFVGKGAFVPLLKLLLLCVVPLVALAAFCSLRYLYILAGLTSHAAKSDYTLGALQKQSLKKALLKKEIKRYLNTPIWLFNTSFGLLLLLGCGVASLAFGGQAKALLQQMQLPNLPMLQLVALLLAFSLGLTNITAASISLEGKQMQLLRSLPIKERDILAAKLGFHLMLALPVGVVSALLLCIGLRLGVYAGVVLCVASVLLNWFVAASGLVCNLHFPKMDAASDTVVVKQSASLVVALLLAVLALVLLGFVWAKLGEVVCLAVLLGFCLIAQGYLGKNGTKLLRNIEL